MLHILKEFYKFKTKKMCSILNSKPLNSTVPVEVLCADMFSYTSCIGKQIVYIG